MAKRKAKTIPEYLTEEEIDRLFSVIKSPRDTALFRLAYHRGLRASELGMIQLGDYREKAQRIMIRRLKGSNSGEFPLVRSERLAISAWLRVRGMAPGPLFTTRQHGRISRTRLDQLMKEYCAKAHIAPERAHMHALKHSCGTYLSAHDTDIVAIQDHLGHSNIQNTMIYVQVTNKRREQFAGRHSDWR